MKTFTGVSTYTPDRWFTKLILLSPFALIVMGQLIVWLIGSYLGTYAWAYLFGGYWISLAALILICGGKNAILRWLQPSQGGPVWPSVAIAFSLVTTIWMFIPNWHYLIRPEILILTIIFVSVNPCLEEGYWRGLLIDSAKGWPSWIAILYSSLLFAINHLFVMIVVPAGRNPAVWVYQLIVGVLLSFIYTRTKSLRWPIVSHAVINLLSLSVAMFMNVYIPKSPW